jgi:hypothetical protein
VFKIFPQFYICIIFLLLSFTTYNGFKSNNQPSEIKGLKADNCQLEIFGTGIESCGSKGKTRGNQQGPVQIKAICHKPTAIRMPKF